MSGAQAAIMVAAGLVCIGFCLLSGVVILLVRSAACMLALAGAVVFYAAGMILLLRS